MNWLSTKKKIKGKDNQEMLNKTIIIISEMYIK